MKVKACKMLNYNEKEYGSNCRIEQLGSNKFVWERITIDGELQLCQFCKKRGRLNNPEACTSKEHARCSDYKEGEIEIIVRDRTYHEYSIDELKQLSKELTENNSIQELKQMLKPPESFYDLEQRKIIMYAILSKGSGK